MAARENSGQIGPGDLQGAYTCPPARIHSESKRGKRRSNGPGMARIVHSGTLTALERVICQLGRVTTCLLPDILPARAFGVQAEMDLESAVSGRDDVLIGPR